MIRTSTIRTSLLLPASLAALAYVTPADRLQGRQEAIWAARDQKLEAARERRAQTRRAARAATPKASQAVA